MTSITGFARVLLDPEAELTDAERVDLLERIAANTGALATMTTAMLSEADTGATRPEDDSSSVEDLFRLVRGVSEAQLSECGGRLTTGSDVAELPVPVGAIRQAVINLVSNSVKYRDPSRPVQVHIEARATPVGVEIVVRDNGKGLSEASGPLFDAGIRGAASGGTTGAGLGLAFVQAAVERVGGSVTGGPLDPGAEFVITLVRDTETPVEEVAPAAHPAEAAGLRLTAPQLDLVLGSSPVPTFVIDIALRQIVRVNRAGTELLGLPESDILDRPGSDFVDEATIAAALRRRVLDQPDARTALRTTMRTARGDLAVRIWIAAVEGSALAVAQAVSDDRE